ncbi:hypothetical protein STEG23_002952, partial [Scotinomys teguina]
MTTTKSDFEIFKRMMDPSMMIPHGLRTALPGAGARDPATKLGALFVRDFPRVYLPGCQTHTSNTGYFN